jgi:hypothetical protein
LRLHIALIIQSTPFSQFQLFFFDVNTAVLFSLHKAGLFVQSLNLQICDILLELAFVSDRGEVIFNIGLWFFLNLGVLGNEVKGLALLQNFNTHFLSVALFEASWILLFSFDKLANLHLLIGYLMIEHANNFGSIFVSILNGLELPTPIFKLFF